MTTEEIIAGFRAITDEWIREIHALTPEQSTADTERHDHANHNSLPDRESLSRSETT